MLLGKEQLGGSRGRFAEQRAREDRGQTEAVGEMAGDRDRPEEAAQSLLTPRQAPETTGFSGGRREFCFQIIDFNLCHPDELSSFTNMTFCPPEPFQSACPPVPAPRRLCASRQEATLNLSTWAGQQHSSLGNTRDNRDNSEPDSHTNTEPFFLPCSLPGGTEHHGFSSHGGFVRPVAAPWHTQLLAQARGDT